MCRSSIRATSSGGEKKLGGDGLFAKAPNPCGRLGPDSGVAKFQPTPRKRRLDQVRMRPSEEEEQERFEQRFEKEHDLRCARLGGPGRQYGAGVEAHEWP